MIDEVIVDNLLSPVSQSIGFERDLTDERPSRMATGFSNEYNTQKMPCRRALSCLEEEST